jgi:hypothetical protein
MDAYVYGVLSATPESSPPGRGVDGQPLELVESGELAALVSDAPEVPVRANRRNLMAHTDVLRRVAVERGVLPMRFGVVMPDRDAVCRELLEAHGRELSSQLEAFEPYVELDVRVLCPEDALLRSVLSDRPDIAKLRSDLAARPPDATYYERIRLGELVAQAVGAKRAGVVATLTARLEPLAAAADHGDPLHDEMLANVAFLVARDRVGAFDAAVDELAETLGPDARVSSIGPLAVHRFVDLGAESEAGAWA